MGQLLRATPVPALGQPPLRLGIAPGFDKLQELRIVHRSAGDLAARQEDLVPRPLVVEGKALAHMADLPQPRCHRQPGRCGRRRGFGCCRLQRLVGRPQRVTGQQVLDVGEQQFLVLLLMLETKLH